MSERDEATRGEPRGEDEGEQGAEELRSVRIPGRDFAGANIAATEEQQTRDRRTEGAADAAQRRAADAGEGDEGGETYALDDPTD